MLITHGHQDHVVPETLLQLRGRVDAVVVPRSSRGNLCDPSLALYLSHLGLPVVEVDDFSEVTFPGGKVTAAPFLGEHAYLDIRAKTTYCVQLGGRTIFVGADSSGIDPGLYRHIRAHVGKTDMAFLGMECAGAPLTWVYQALLTQPLDPISLMATGEVDGKRLDDLTIIVNCYSLIMGGDGTNRLSMIGGLKALIDNPDQWAALKNGDVTPQTACEEVLRWTTPTMHFGRVAVVDTAIAGKNIAAGDLVTLWFSSANRDETVFEEPETFDLGRSPNKHVALGYGRHFCIGGYLGRMEVTTMLDALRAFVVGMEQKGPERYIYSNFLQGMSSLPVALKGNPSKNQDWED